MHYNTLPDEMINILTERKWLSLMDGHHRKPHHPPPMRDGTIRDGAYDMAYNVHIKARE